MYEYKFVKVELKGALRLEPKEDCEKIANELGKQGWRLMQVLAPPTVGYGLAGYYELIFERKV